MIALAFDLVEKKMRDGSATAAETVHFLKLGSENAKLERSAVYRFQARWAKQWNKGRCLIGGDAAFEALLAQVVAFVEAPGMGLNLPLDARARLRWGSFFMMLNDCPQGLTA